MKNMKIEIEELREQFEDFKRGNETPPVIAEFQKVSINQFKRDFEGSNVDTVYNEVLTLPVRSSEGSAGHDFILTKDIELAPGQSVKICTGIRAKMNEGWALYLMPRSGLGSKFRMQLNNTIGLIDQDYYNADNEGHIMATITNDSKDSNNHLSLKAGDRFIQGVFIEYGVAVNDSPLGVRTGGHGSSGLQ